MPLSGVKVVLIDDSNTIRRSGEIFLSQAGCSVVLAEDGFDGLSKVVDIHPDIIFVDVMMPRLDGYQTCALIKNNPQFKEYSCGHVDQQGYAVRPRTGKTGRFRPVSDQTV